MTARFQEYDLELCKQYAAQSTTVVIIINKVDAMQEEERKALKSAIENKIKGLDNILPQVSEVSAFCCHPSIDR